MHKLKKVSPFRKVAIGSWKTAYDPTVYGTVEVRMEEAERYIQKFREQKGAKLTVTHLVAKTVAQVLKDNPEANGILRFNRIYLRDQVDVGVLVLADDPETGEVDLSSAVVRKADTLSLVELIDAIGEQVKGIRSGQDKAMKSAKSTIRKVPYFMMNCFMNFLSFLLYTLNLNMTWAGMPKDAFGGAVITSIGSLGLDTAYVPLVPYTRVPIFIAPGEVKTVPVVDDGEVVPGRRMGIHASFDHRFIDGAHAAKMAKAFRLMIENPFQHFDPLD